MKLLCLVTNGGKESMVGARLRKDAAFIHTDDHPYRGPAAIVSLRPVTLRPYLSISLPSDCTLIYSIYPSQKSTDKRSNFWMSGCQNFVRLLNSGALRAIEVMIFRHPLNQAFFGKRQRLPCRYDEMIQDAHIYQRQSLLSASVSNWSDWLGSATPEG